MPDEPPRRQWLRGRLAAVRSASHAAAAWLAGSFGRSVLLVLLLLAVLFPEDVRDRLGRAADVWFGWGRGQPIEGGLIRVEAPRIFTRERLVNDRFDEAAWLERRLADTDELLGSGAFARPAGTRRTGSRLGVDMAAGDAGEETDVTGAAATAPAATLSPEAQVLAATQYREALRRRAIAANLDDAHDLEGNTLYRLDFAAYAVPPAYADAVASIEIRVIERTDRTGDALTVLPGDPLTEPEKRNYGELLEEWREELQRQARSLLDDRIRTLQAGVGLDPDNAALLDEFIRYEIHAILFEPLKGADEALGTPTAAAVDVLRRRGQEALLQAIWKDIARDLYRAREQAEGKPDPSGPPEFGIIEYREYRRLCSAHANVLPPGHHFNGAVGLAGPVACQQVPADWETLADLDLLDTLYRIDHWIRASTDGCTAELRDLADSPSWIAAGAEEWPPLNGVMDFLEGADCLSEDWSGFRAALSVVDPWPRRNRVLANFLVRQLTQQHSRIPAALNFGEFFSFKVGGCTATRCDVLVKPHYWPDVPRGSESRNWNSLPRNWNLLPKNGGSEAGADDRISKLRDRLRDGQRAATYGVFPESAQSLHDVREVSGTTMRFGGPGGGVDAGERVERQAIEALGGIVGIANWRSEPGAAHFGWLVYPGPGSQRSARPQPIYLPLGALISLPSWWRQATLEVRSCWRSRAAAAAGRADCEGLEPEKLHIGLPGSPVDLSRRLKFDVVKFPFVTGGQPFEHVVEIGRPAQLTIVGGRLWKNPRVQLANQRASRVQVLPDMNGIVAEFACIEPWPGTSGLRQSPAVGARPPSLMLRIWTSKGMTSPLPVMSQPFAVRAGEDHERPCFVRETAETGD